MKKISRWQNLHLGYSEITRYVDSQVFGKYGRMSYGISTIYVGPRIEGGEIVILDGLM